MSAVQKIELTEIPEPTPKANEVKIKVYSAGICGSELHAFKGTHPFRHPPAILGHEMAGEVVEVGAKVENFAVGDRVTVEPQINCGKCEYCLTGYQNLCLNKVVLGTEPWVGAYAEYIVAPEQVTYKIPDSISYDEAVMIEPLAVGVHAIREAKTKIGDSTMIIGGGTIGLCCLVAARASGATNNIVTDTVDFNLRMAKKLGAAGAINVRQDDPKAIVMELTRGKGVDTAFVAVGYAPVVNQALSSVKRLGEVVLIGLLEGKVTLDEPFLIVGGERVIRGSQMYTRTDIQIAIDLIGSGLVDARPFITQRMPMSEVQKGFEIVDTKSEDVVKVVLNW